MSVKKEMPTPQINYAYVGDGQKKSGKYGKYKKILIPNKRIINGFIFVIIGVLAITAMKFPFGAFMSGNLDTSINVGYPLVFAEFKLSGNGSSVFIGNLVMDLLAYVLFAYILNVILNFVMSVSLFKKKVEAEEQPTVFKDQKITMPEKLAEKVAGEK